MKTREAASVSGRHGAFTLVELLVVIAIIALLTAILYSVFFVARKRSNDAVCISHLRQVGMALQVYAQDYDDYPRERDFLHHGLDKLYPVYITDFRILKCPNILPGMRDEPNNSDYGYTYKMASIITHSEEHEPSILSWEQAYELRGERLPLAECRFHGVDLKNSPVGDKSLLTKLVLRMDGSVSKSIKGIPHNGTALAWYDF